MSLQQRLSGIEIRAGFIKSAAGEFRHKARELNLPSKASQAGAAKNQPTVL
jgi:hypothetical protein